jgi:hypothetical protein
MPEAKKSYLTPFGVRLFLPGNKIKSDGTEAVPPAKRRQPSGISPNSYFVIRVDERFHLINAGWIPLA